MEFDLAVLGRESLSGFISSWEEAFGRSLDSSVYEWIFDGRNIVYAARIKGEVAAGYCLYPLSCMLNGEVGIALLCNNVFVNPRYQGRHLFVKLGKLALEDAGLNGRGEIAFGIPNALALPGHKRVGWGIQEPIRFVEKITGPKEKNLAVWVFGELTQSQRADIEKCSRDASIGRAFSIIKTEDFVRWRYESKPGVQYWFGLRYDDNGNLIAYCVCKFYELSSSLHFIDIDGVDKEAIALLVSEANNLPEDFERLNVWSSTAHCKIFIDAGYYFVEKQDNLIFIEPGSRNPVYFQENTNICLGDNDVY